MKLVKEAYIAYKTVAKVESVNELILDNSERAAEYLRKYWERLSPDVESFVVICLNARRRAVHVSTITTGIATASLAHPREVFRIAVMNSACSVIVAHNHPSGDPSPSGADFSVTSKLKQAAQILDIQLCDHIILGEKQYDPLEKGFYSFRDSGVI